MSKRPTPISKPLDELDRTLRKVKQDAVDELLNKAQKDMREEAERKNKSWFLFPQQRR
jgi:hypothetical protein